MSINNLSSVNRSTAVNSQATSSINKPEQRPSTEQVNRQQRQQATQQVEKKQSSMPELENETKETKKAMSEDEVLRAIEQANVSIHNENAKFEYSIHEETKRIMVKIVDKVNNEVIKEIPAEEVLDLVAKIWEMSGILLDEKR